MKMKRTNFSPIQTVLHLTDDCNLRCTYCFVKDKNPNYMSFDVARKALDWAVKGDNDQLGVVFFGGEPLLCFEMMKEIVKYGRSLEKVTGKKISFSMTSNGTLFSPKILEFMNINRIRFHFSIDGAPRTQDLHRRTIANRGTSQILIEKIPLIRRLEREASVRMTITPQTAKYLFENIVFLVEKGFRHIAPVTVFEAQWTEKSLSDLRREWEKVATLFIQYALRGERIELKHLCDGMKFLDSNRSKLYPCGAGRNMISIDAGGDVYPCHRFVANKDLKKYMMGTIDQPAEIDFTEFSTLTYQLMEGCKGLNEELETGDCKKCKIRFHCTGGCLAVNASCNSSIYKPISNYARLYPIYLNVAHRTSYVLREYCLPVRKRSNGAV